MNDSFLIGWWVMEDLSNKKSHFVVPGGGVLRELLAGLLLLVLFTPCCFAAQGEEPILVAAAVDTSGSLAPSDLAQAEEVILELIGNLPENSKITLFCFDDDVHQVLLPTKDRTVISSTIASIKRGGRYTFLNDALFEALEYLKLQKTVRRSLVLLSDGRDENSAVLADDVVRLANELAIPVFTIRIGGARQVDEQALRRLAKLTGGFYAPIESIDSARLAWSIAESSAPSVTSDSQSSSDTSNTGSEEPERADPEDSGPSRPDHTSTSEGLQAWLPLVKYLLALVLIGSVIAAILINATRPGKRATSDDHKQPLVGGEGDTASPGTAQGQVSRTNVPYTLPSRFDVTTKLTAPLDAGWIITAKSGPEAGKSFEIKVDGVIHIGRNPSCDVQLDDNAVSGVHCVIRSDRHRLRVEDLDSTNGTEVNDNPIKSQYLMDNDTIRLGRSVLVVNRIGGGEQVLSIDGTQLS